MGSNAKNSDKLTCRSFLFALATLLVATCHSTTVRKAAIATEITSNAKEFLFGANLPWYNGYRGLDLAPYRGEQTIATVAATCRGGPCRDLQVPPSPIHSGDSGFDAKGIEGQLRDAKSIGMHTLRWFFGGDGRSFMKFDAQGFCTGIDPIALENVERILKIAAENKIFILPVLFDFRFVSGDEFLLYADGSRARPHADIIRDPKKRAALIQNFIVPLAQKFSGTKAIKYWEIMNEAGNVVREHATAKSLTKQELQIFLNEAYDAIKRVDKNHPVMPSGLARPSQLPIVVGAVKADLYGAHYNDNGSDWNAIQTVAQIKINLAKDGLTLDKPLIMTEGPAGVKGHLDDYAQKAFSGGWAGYLAWTYYDVAGLNFKQRYAAQVTSESPKANKARGQRNIAFYRKFNLDHESSMCEF